MGHNKNDLGDGASTSEFHVLAVDDSVVDRKIIEGLLRSSSYQVTTVNSVRKALEFLGLEDDDEGLNADNVRVNMIITDYCMPGLTGYDLLRRVKDSSTLKDIPVVIMSSENVESRIDRCLSEGAEEFLLKPVQLSDIKKLGSHMLNWRSSSRDQQQPTSTKRKNMSDSLSPQAERRTRFSGLTVA